MTGASPPASGRASVAAKDPSVSKAIATSSSNVVSSSTPVLHPAETVTPGDQKRNEIPTFCASQHAHDDPTVNTTRGLRSPSADRVETRMQEASPMSTPVTKKSTPFSGYKLQTPPKHRVQGPETPGTTTSSTPASTPGPPPARGPTVCPPNQSGLALTGAVPPTSPATPRKSKGGRKAANPHLTEEQRRQERVLKNRESAMKSLQKKKRYTQNLEHKAVALAARNAELRNKIRVLLLRLNQLSNTPPPALVPGTSSTASVNPSGSMPPPANTHYGSYNSAIATAAVAASATPAAASNSCLRPTVSSPLCTSFSLNVPPPPTPPPVLESPPTSGIDWPVTFDHITHPSPLPSTSNCLHSNAQDPGKSSGMPNLSLPELPCPSMDSPI